MARYIDVNLVPEHYVQGNKNQINIYCEAFNNIAKDIIQKCTENIEKQMNDQKTDEQQETPNQKTDKKPDIRTIAGLSKEQKEEFDKKHSSNLTAFEDVPAKPRSIADAFKE